jgi:hypothetical protein
MEIVASPLDWTAVDEERWNGFLNTETGRRLIPKLLESVPGLLPGGDTNAILIRAGEHRGLQLAVSQLLSMSHSTPEVKTEMANDSYPPLEKDDAWNDGQKLEEIPAPKPVADII